MHPWKLKRLWDKISFWCETQEVPVIWTQHNGGHFLCLWKVLFQSHTKFVQSLRKDNIAKYEKQKLQTFSLRMTNKVAFWGKTSVCSECKSWVGTLSDRCDTLLWNAKQMCLGFDFYVELFANAVVILRADGTTVGYFMFFGMVQSTCAHNLSQCITEILIPYVLF